MKTLFLSFVAFFSFNSFAQQTITSTQNGDFFAFGTWDCFCLPQDGDTVIINHDVNMNFGIPYTMGQIIVNASGSLKDGGTDKDVYINGGDFFNYGLVELDGFWLDSGSFVNEGNMLLDSLWTQDVSSNTGTIITFDFLHDQLASFQNDGSITVNNNYSNQGTFVNAPGSSMSIANDASNCNIQGNSALFDNDGIVCVTGDFINCGSDTLTGDGYWFVDGQASNTGDVLENLQMNFNGGAWALNTGNVASTVTIGSDPCFLSVGSSTMEISLYPNPAEHTVFASEVFKSAQVYDAAGRVVHKVLNSNTIDISTLENGVYIIQLQTLNGSEQQLQLIKE